MSWFSQYFKIVIAVVINLPNSITLHPHSIQCKIFVSLVVQTFCWWMKAVYFVGYYFHICDLIRKICRKKNIAKNFNNKCDSTSLLWLYTPISTVETKIWACSWVLNVAEISTFVKRIWYLSNHSSYWNGYISQTASVIQILTALRGTVKIIGPRWCQNHDYAQSEAEGIVIVLTSPRAYNFNCKGL